MMTIDLSGLVEKARKTLQEAKSGDPGKLEFKGYQSERAVVQVRDHLIERFRKNDSDTTNVKESLDKVNTALSLVVGLEFPLAGKKRDVIDYAVRLLDEVRAT